jgi:hypothetical protein
MQRPLSKHGEARPRHQPEAESPLELTLRDVEVPPPPQDDEKPADDGLVVSDPELRPLPWLGDPEAERAAQRAARRAQVRKDRLRDAADSGFTPPVIADEIAVPSPPMPQTPPTSTIASANAATPDRTKASSAARVTAAPAATATPPTSATSTAAPKPAASVTAAPPSTLPDAVTTPATTTAAAPNATPAAVARPAAPDAPSAASTPAAPAILLLRANGTDPDPLSEQLRAFGFDVQVRSQPPELPAPWPFVAVFVDLALHPADGGDAIDLCNDVRERSRLPGVLKPVLVLVADQLTPTNRVRAGLAGCNEILLGEITRGGVARVLDTRGIALPSDARRS